MAQQYYLKDKKIDIYEGTTVNIGGVKKTTYNKIYSSLWAYYRQENGSSVITGSAIKVYDTTERAIFVINRIAALRSKTLSLLKIKYNGRVYDLDKIDDYEGYADDYKINATYSSTQSYPGIDY